MVTNTNYGFGLLSLNNDENPRINLRYKLVRESSLDTMNLICLYLAPWLTEQNIERWRNDAIFDDEIQIIASDIDKLYAYIGSTWFDEDEKEGKLTKKKEWILIEIPSVDLLAYGLKHWGFDDPRTVRDREEERIKQYSLLRTQPPPIILGASHSKKPELLDGMHRIYAANVAGIKSLVAFIPEDGLRWLVKL